MPLPADQVAPTGYAPFSKDNPLDGNVYAFLTGAQGGQEGAVQKLIGKLLRKNGMRSLNAVMLSLNGTAVGSNATKTYARVKAQATDPNNIESGFTLGGVRAIETITSINRNTVASDETLIDTLMNQVQAQAIASYPVDASGNGGGGKAGV